MSDTLGIDLGTSAIKIGRFDKNNDPVAIVSRDYHKADEHEVDSEAFWNALVDGVRELTISTQSRPPIAGIGLSSQTNSFLLLDSDHRPVTPIHLWTGDWADDDANKLNERFGHQIGECVGMAKLTGQLLAPKCIHLKNAEPDTWARMTSLWMLPDWITWRLTGQAVTDPSLWSLSGLYDLNNDDWWSGMIAHLGINPNHLPHLSETGNQAGLLRTEVANELALDAKTPVAVGALDHLAAAIAVGNTRPGIASISTGTASCVIVTHDQRPPLIKSGVIGRHPKEPRASARADAARWYALAWSGLSSTGLSWHARHCRTSINDLLEKGKNVRAGANGWTAAPRNPNNGDAGFDFHHATSSEPTQAEATRAILECLTNELKRLTNEAAASRPIEQAILTGGGAQAPLWCTLIAEALQTSVTPWPCLDASAQGAAKLARNIT